MPPHDSSRSVSLYVPCFNGAQFLSETLGAIRALSYPIAGLIVVDDGSTDSSMTIAKEHGARILSHTSNRGLAASRNTALAVVETPFIAAVDADTVVDRNWLERLMAVFSDETIGGAGGRLVERYTSTIPDQWRLHMMAQHHGDSQKVDAHIFGCNSVMRTDLLRSIGGYDERYRTSFDDIDSSEKIIKAGFHTYYEPTALCYHCRQDTLTSIAESAYRWRLPPFEQQGVFTDPAKLCAKWITEVREGLKDIKSLKAQGKQNLLFPSYYMVFQSLVADTLRVTKGDQRNPIYLGSEEALKKTALVNDNFSEEFKIKLVERITKRFAGPLDRKAPEFQYETVFTKDPTDSLEVLNVALSELPTVFRFSPDTTGAIEESYRACVANESK